MPILVVDWLLLEVDESATTDTDFHGFVTRLDHLVEQQHIGFRPAVPNGPHAGAAALCWLARRRRSRQPVSSIIMVAPTLAPTRMGRSQPSHAIGPRM
jgi:hypothetical protein